MKTRKKREKKKKFRIYDIFAIILVLASIFFTISIIYVNILVLKYLLIIIGILLLINLINIFFIRKGKKKIKLIASITSLLLGSIMTIGSIYIFKTTDVLSNSNVNYKTYDFSILVLSNSNYETINDLEEKTLGYYESSTLDSDLYLNKISDKITATFKNSISNNELLSNLTSNKVEAIVIEDSYLSILKDGDYRQEGINDIETDTKIIYNFSVKVNVKNISKDLDVTKKAFNIYISGMDEYGTVSSVSRSDVNIVATVNPETREILLTSIPRDYYVQLHGTTGYKDKLTHAGLYGVESSVKTIEDLLDIEINYYVKVNFSSVVDMIDAIGGVNVYSEYTFTSDDGYYYKKGYNKVDGKEALSFVRERHAFVTGDNQRGRNQQALIKAVIKKCTSSSIIYKYNSLLNSLDGSFMTNMSTNRITSLIKMQLNDMRSWNITSNNLTGSNGSDYTYSYSSQKLYVMIPDEESIEQTKLLINTIIDGGKVEDIDSQEDTDETIHSVTKPQTIPNNTTSSTNIEANTTDTNTTEENTSEKEENTEITNEETENNETTPQEQEESNKESINTDTNEEITTDENTNNNQAETDNNEEPINQGDQEQETENQPTEN